MSPFAWFAVILTVAYIIYYTVMIMNDLYGKKSEKKEKAEEIDVPAAEDDATFDESPIEVSESDAGFSVGGEEYESMVAASEAPAREEEEVPNAWEENGSPMMPGETLTNATEENSEEIETQFSDPYGPVDFKRSLVHDGPVSSGKPNILKKEVFDEI